MVFNGHQNGRFSGELPQIWNTSLKSDASTNNYLKLKNVFIFLNILLVLFTLVCSWIERRQGETIITSLGKTHLIQPSEKHFSKFQPTPKFLNKQTETVLSCPSSFLIFRCLHFQQHDVCELSLDFFFPNANSRFWKRNNCILCKVWDGKCLVYLFSACQSK